jgi:hypothetical protein
VDELNVQSELVDPPDVSETTDGEHVMLRPDAGLTDSVRDTLPAKPPRLVREIVEDPLPPDWNATVAGLGVTS